MKNKTFINKITDLFNFAKNKDIPKPTETASYPTPLYNEFSGYANLLSNPNAFFNPLNVGNNDIMSNGAYMPLQVYDHINRTDAEIAKCIFIRRLSVPATGCSILVEKETDISFEFHRLINQIFYDYIPNFNTFLFNVLSAFISGFSVHEIEWSKESFKYIKTDKQGVETTINTGLKLIPINFIHRQPYSYIFDTDGNMRILTKSNIRTGEELNQSNYFIYSNQAEYGNPYGTSLIGQKLFYSYMEKRETKIYYDFFMKKYSIPFPIAKYSDVLNRKDIEEFNNAISNLEKANGIMLHKECDVQLHQVHQDSGDFYKEKIDFINMEFNTAILGEALGEVNSSTTSSSNAFANVQAKVRDDIRIADCQALENSINALIKTIISINYESGTYTPDEIPYLQFDYKQKEDLKTKSEYIKNLVDTGLPITVKQIYDEFNIVTPEDGEKTLNTNKNNEVNELDIDTNIDIKENIN